MLSSPSPVCLLKGVIISSIPLFLVDAAALLQSDFTSSFLLYFFAYSRSARFASLSEEDSGSSGAASLVTGIGVYYCEGYYCCDWSEVCLLKLKCL